MEYARSLALLIGLDVYQSQPRFPGAVRSAEALTSVLRRVYRFEVSTLFNQQATRGAVTRELDRLQGAERAVIYYAGRVNNAETLNLYNTDPAIPNTGIGLERLLRQFDALPARHALLILDATLDRLPGLESLPEKRTFTEEQFTERARLVMGAGLSAWQTRERWGDDDASMFTAQLIYGLRGNAANTDGLITGDRLARYVLEDLRHNSKGKAIGWAGQLPNAPGDLLFREVAPLELPDDVTEGLRSGFPSLRYRSVSMLAYLIDKGDPIVAPLAIEKLREVAAENDSINVRKMAVDELMVRDIDPDAENIPILRVPPPPRPGAAPDPEPSSAPPAPMPGERAQTLVVIGVMIGVFAIVAFLILHFS